MVLGSFLVFASLVLVLTQPTPLEQIAILTFINAIFIFLFLSVDLGELEEKVEELEEELSKEE